MFYRWTGPTVARQSHDDINVFSVVGFVTCTRHRSSHVHPYQRHCRLQRFNPLTPTVAIWVRLYSIPCQTGLSRHLWLLTSGHSDAQSWASECPDVKNHKWRLNPVWHRILCHMATVGVIGLKSSVLHCIALQTASLSAMITSNVYNRLIVLTKQTNTASSLTLSVIFIIVLQWISEQTLEDDNHNVL